jgi:hypothetical protein
MNDSLATYVVQSVTPQIHAGLVTVTYTYSDYGEFNTLIVGSVTYGAVNNCMS